MLKNYSGLITGQKMKILCALFFCSKLVIVLLGIIRKGGQTDGKIAGYRIEKDVDGIGRYVTESISRKTEGSNFIWVCCTLNGY